MRPLYVGVSSERRVAGDMRREVLDEVFHLARDAARKVCDPSMSVRMKTANCSGVLATPLHKVSHPIGPGRPAFICRNRHRDCHLPRITLLPSLIDGPRVGVFHFTRILYRHAVGARDSCGNEGPCGERAGL